MQHQMYKCPLGFILAVWCASIITVSMSARLKGNTI